MSRIPKFWGMLACMAALTAMFMFLLNINETRQNAWRLAKADLVEKNAPSSILSYKARRLWEADV